MQHQQEDVLGLRAGYLTATAFYKKDGPRRRKGLIALCDCGTEVRMKPGDFMKLIRNANISSCGCKRKETIGSRNTTHGMTSHPSYAVWRSMLARCYTPTHQAWDNYGGRGITVCGRWRESFANFWADMAPGYAAGLTLDREDNNAGYSASNCRWVTPEVQANNKRDNVHISGLTVAQFSRATGIGQTTLLYRLKAGVSSNRLAEAPNVARRFTTSSTADPAQDLFA